MSQRKVPVNRTLVGILAVSCVVAGLAVCVVRGIDDPFAGAFVRVGLLLGALWCALPTRTRDAAWANVSPMMVLVFVVGAVLVVRNLRALLPVAVVLAGLAYFLRPRTKKRPSHTER